MNCTKHKGKVYDGVECKLLRCKGCNIDTYCHDSSPQNWREHVIWITLKRISNPSPSSPLHSRFRVNSFDRITHRESLRRMRDWKEEFKVQKLAQEVQDLEAGMMGSITLVVNSVIPGMTPPLQLKLVIGFASHSWRLLEISDDWYNKFLLTVDKLSGRA